MWNIAETRPALSQDPVQDEIASLCRSRGLEGQLTLPGVVADSWKRCLADYNLLPDRVPRAEVLAHSEMRDLMGASEDLLRIAEPEVERLFLRLVDSEYLVSLASPQGVMLLFRCDYQYLGDLAGQGVLPGSVWTEERQGTNGVGTCINIGKSVSIVGSQHYGVATQSLTCLTSPVFGRNGMIESVINVTTARSGDERMNRVVQNIVERSARRIENGYFGRLHRQSHMLRLMENTETADLAEEGRIALDDNGLILSASSHLAKLLGRPVDQLIGARAEELFDLGRALSDIRPHRPVSMGFAGKTLQAVLATPETRQQRVAVVPGSFAPSPPIMPLHTTDLVEEELRIDPITSQALDRATRLVNAGLPLIVSGETGSGKTSFAKTVARRCFGTEGELVFIDCA
ncbi:MAG: sigma 54-interacting transcriptional regulator, partial [Cypionkella sp.]|uniref:sigma-54-dependent Fis family transcriptional regulator n=1 Tax=Cypionkella sp. TaxID=2811411 RepID=UPI002AB93467